MQVMFYKLRRGETCRLFVECSSNMEEVVWVVGKFYEWFDHFRNGWISLCDEQWKVRPSTSKTMTILGDIRGPRFNYYTVKCGV